MISSLVDHIYQIPYALMLCTALVASVWFVRFIQLHAFHKSTVQSYLHRQQRQDGQDGEPSSAWVLVTGASDGIGFGLVEEFASRGFNVILHGRNAEKLEHIKKTLGRKYSARSFRVLVIDASDREQWSAGFSTLLSELHTLEINLNVLVNNVGGGGGPHPAFQSMLHTDPDAVKLTTDLNATFPAAITHALLPTLARNQPSLIVTIGSVAGSEPPPYLALYAGSKAYNMAWSQSIGREMVAEGLHIEVLGILVGKVEAKHSKGQDFSKFTMPSSRDFARAVVNKIGCGRPVAFGYWPHELQMLAVSLSPAWLVSNIITREAKREMAWEKSLQ